MKLSEYAKRVGIKYHTAFNWWKAGQIRGAWQAPSGTIIVPDEVLPNASNNDQSTSTQRTRIIIYARVSSNEQRSTTLESQAERLTDYCMANGWTVSKIVKEVGSGLNDRRPKLESLLMDPTVKRIVVEHRDRLTRYGFHYLELMANELGFEIIVANETLDNDKNDLMADFTAIITSFCSRLYAQRQLKNKKKAMLDALADGDD